MLSTPLSGWLDATGCPSRCHEKRAGGSESDKQVRRTVCPTITSPPPTQSFGVSLVSTGVSGPSGLGMIRGHRYQHQKHSLQKFKKGEKSRLKYTDYKKNKEKKNSFLTFFIIQQLTPVNFIHFLLLQQAGSTPEFLPGECWRA